MKYDIIVKEGKNKNRIVASGYANNKKEAIQKNKQTLIDCGLHVEAADIVFTSNYKVKLYKD